MVILKKIRDVILTGIAYGTGIILIAAGALAFLYLLGTAVENIGERQDEHNRCLKNATNGYEIQQCR
jgi:hypothetical protein